jgi:hypothetical protein
VGASRQIVYKASLPLGLGGFLVIALPWYVWTVHTTGDPLYPFATGMFGDRAGLWTATEIKFQGVVARGFVGPGVGAVLTRDLQYLCGSIGYDTGVHRSPLSWWLGAGFLGLLIPSLRRGRTFLAAVAAAALCVVASLFVSADPRYLVPALGPFALCAGLTAEAVIDLLPRSQPQILGHRTLVPIWGIIAAALMLWTSASYAVDLVSERQSAHRPGSDCGLPGSDDPMLRGS